MDGDDKGAFDLRGEEEASFAIDVRVGLRGALVYVRVSLFIARYGGRGLGG